MVAMHLTRPRVAIAAKQSAMGLERSGGRGPARGLSRRGANPNPGGRKNRRAGAETVNAQFSMKYFHA
jgi:hypothetical protein